MYGWAGFAEITSEGASSHIYFPRYMTATSSLTFFTDVAHPAGGFKDEVWSWKLHARPVRRQLPVAQAALTGIESQPADSAVRRR